MSAVTSPSAPDRRGVIAFVPSRYGKGVVGGAEAVMAENAHGLAQRGWQVEILTTCAKDHYTWENIYPAGETKVGGVTVRRFPVVVPKSMKLRNEIGTRILEGGDVSVQDQEAWMNAGMRVPELWHHVLDHGRSYRAICVQPYLNWTTFACGQIYPEKTIIMLSLHDEPFAHLDIFQPLVSGAAGLWVQTGPEDELARKIFRVPVNTAMVKASVDVPQTYDPEAFRQKFGIARPFILYTGRREWGKGWEGLVRVVGDAVREGVEIDLVTAGVGDPKIPKDLRHCVHDLGFVSDADRDNAMAAATAYVQPSGQESFSRTVLEAWLAGTFVVANAHSQVVRWHIERSSAGVCYESDQELKEALRFVAESPAHARRLAAPGRRYVLDNYQPADVIDAVEQTLVDWTTA